MTDKDKLRAIIDEHISFYEVDVKVATSGNEKELENQEVYATFPYELMVSECLKK